MKLEKVKKRTDERTNERTDEHFSWGNPFFKKKKIFFHSGIVKIETFVWYFAVVSKLKTKPSMLMNKTNVKLTDLEWTSNNVLQACKHVFIVPITYFSRATFVLSAASACSFANLSESCLQQKHNDIKWANTIVIVMITTFVWFFAVVSKCKMKPSMLMNKTNVK